VRSLSDGCRPLRWTRHARWANHDPRERHWHLGPIGVHPEHQGQGIGKAMLGPFLKMVDAQRSPHISRPTWTGMSRSTRPLAFA
jgi:GNAT superfamily N-acetyltransferase